MARGRPPVWNPFAKASPGAWTELVSIEERGRIMLSPSVRNCLAWLSPNPPSAALAIIRDSDRAEVVPWDAQADALIASQVARLNNLAEPERGNLAIELANSHFRLTIEKPGRVTLPASLRSFLQTGDRHEVRLVALHDQLWAWNEQAWQAARRG